MYRSRLARSSRVRPPFARASKRVSTTALASLLSIPVRLSVGARRWDLHCRAVISPRRDPRRGSYGLAWEPRVPPRLPMYLSLRSVYPPDEVSTPPQQRPLGRRILCFGFCCFGAD